MEDTAKPANNSYYSLSQIRGVCVNPVFPPPLAFQFSEKLKKGSVPLSSSINLQPISLPWEFIWPPMGCTSAFPTAVLLSPANSPDPLQMIQVRSACKTPSVQLPPFVYFLPKKPDKENCLTESSFHLVSQPCQDTINSHGFRTRSFSPSYILSCLISLPRSAYTTLHLAFRFCHHESSGRFRNMRGHTVSTQLDEMHIKVLRKAIVPQPFHQSVVPPGRMSFILPHQCLSRLL